MRVLRQSAEKHFNTNLDARKQFITSIIRKALQDLQDENERKAISNTSLKPEKNTNTENSGDHHDDEDYGDEDSQGMHNSDVDEGDQEPDDAEEKDRLLAEKLQEELGGRRRPTRAAAMNATKNSRKRTASKSRSKEEDGTVKKRSRPSPTMCISPQLAAVLVENSDQPLPETMTRKEIMQGLWAYFRRHSLQDPKDGREILLDAPLRAVFGERRSVHFMKMNKFLVKHMWKEGE
jgi:chromatin remodeling complex protein RSC6